MQRFTCDCGHTLFFGNSTCLGCGREVGYDPKRGEMVRLRNGGSTKRCANGVQHGVCNWLVPVTLAPVSGLPPSPMMTGTLPDNAPMADPNVMLADASQELCIACRMNRIIPDLRWGRNLMLWGRMEMAKRRLIYSILRLGISLPTKAENVTTGLAFDIVSTVSNPNVTTGHLNGVITVNLEEADDTYRQINRQQLGENSRTLLGHFRHESAHYFWQRNLSELNWDDPLRLAFRERFGNEWLDYSTALSTHYQNGAPAGWEQNYISAYAASHPWEDWAETWAHYLQIVDGLETCESLGIQVKHLALPLQMLPSEAGALPSMLPSSPAADGEFLAWLQRWMCMSTVLNEVSNSLGEQALYPFVISVPVAQKLRLAHDLARRWGGR